MHLHLQSLWGHMQLCGSSRPLAPRHCMALHFMHAAAGAALQHPVYCSPVPSSLYQYDLPYLYNAWHACSHMAKQPGFLACRLIDRYT
jgi:hypothetical protein